MRNNLYTFTLTAAICLPATLIAQTDSMRITYDATVGGASCMFVSKPQCFWIVGVGVTGPNAGWEHRLGNIDTPPIPHQQFGPTGTTDHWTKTIHVYDYFAHPSVDTVPVHPDSTIYRLRFVFAGASGSDLGLDTSCQEFSIKGVNTATLAVVDPNEQPYPWVTAEWITPGQSSVQDLSIHSAKVFPNPSSGSVNIEFTAKHVIDLRVDVLNTFGHVVKTLTETSLTNGHRSLTWDGADGNGNAVANGLYLIRISSAADGQTRQVMVLR